jgi:hypothetical protein
MTKPFNPAKQRAWLLGELGAQWQLSSDFAEAKADNALGGHATSFLGDGISCRLVGLDTEGLALLEKAHAWLDAAISSNEIPRHYDSLITEAMRYHELVLCKWLLSRSGIQEALARCITNLEAYIPIQEKAGDCDEYIVGVYLEAGEYQKAVHLWERTPHDGYLDDEANSRGEGQIAYEICRASLDSNPGRARDALWNVVREFLEENVPTWLADGVYSLAAQWMKIVYCDLKSPPLSPKEALMQCYSFLPGTSPPT